MTKEYLLLEEAAVKELLSPELAIAAIKYCFQEKVKGNFSALPKINIAGANGSLRITPGEARDGRNLIGFRLYDVIRNGGEQPQLTVVYDNLSGRLKGILISQLLGAYRTAAINAVMQHGLKKKATRTLGIVGTGYQARIHLELFHHILQPEKILIYGRTPKNTATFLAEMQQKLGASAQLEVCPKITDLSQVDSLVLATRSQKPLLENIDFKQGITITTIGPKWSEGSEVSNAFAQSCDLVVTDSIEQVKSYSDRFFMTDKSKIIDYADIINQPNLGRKSNNERILICSVGMGGTEVVLGDYLLEASKEKKA